MRSIFFYWSFSIFHISLILLACFLYLYAINFRLVKRSVNFVIAIFLIIICTDSPLNFIGENYLFSAHMLSHILLLLVAGPLLVASIPRKNKFKKSLLFLSKKIYKSPLLNWIIGVGIMWVWHVPYVFNQTMQMHTMQHDVMDIDFLMIVNTYSLLIGGMIFCWPIINPYQQYRIESLRQVLYLSSACVFCSLLGLLITFAPSGMYNSYISGNMNGFLSIVRDEWNISAATDQQMAGLIMWVPCCFIYLTASMVILIKWFNKKDIIQGIPQIAVIK